RAAQPRLQPLSPDGWDRQLNTALIPSQSQGSPSGFVYTWLDDHDHARAGERGLHRADGGDAERSAGQPGGRRGRAAHPVDRRRGRRGAEGGTPQTA
ncbi:MAG TPA: hypothetical protein VL334_21555, partial [Anaerolineae bacterium]|nr:hypothetical protein [Anaerolineae bacterium]